MFDIRQKGATLKEYEASYLAGIIDGEGTISFMKRGDHFFPTVTIANNSRKLLEWCGAKSKLPHSLLNKRPRAAHHSPSYHIRWRHRSALRLAQVCLPYLIIKKKHAALLLNWKRVVRRNGRYTQQELLARNNLVGEIRALNSRPARKTGGGKILSD